MKVINKVRIILVTSLVRSLYLAVSKIIHSFSTPYMIDYSMVYSKLRFLTLVIILRHR